MSPITVPGLATLVINVVATVVLVPFLGALGDLADQARLAGSDEQLLEARDPSSVVHAADAGRARAGDRTIGGEASRPDPPGSAFGTP